MIDYKGSLDIFPTQLHKFKVDQGLIDKTLLEIDLNVKQGDKNLFQEIFNDPKFSDIQNEVEKVSQRFCKQITAKSQENDWKIVTGWLNIQESQRTGFGFHNHIDSFISGVLYLKGSNMSLSFRDEPRGSNKFEPNPVDYDIVVRHTWHPDVSVPVEVGDLILFPSYILHQPNKNESEEMRVSIAYNFLPSRINLKDKPPWTMELNL